MKNRRAVLVLVLILIVAPAVAALAAAVSSHIRNRNNGTLVSSGLKREYLLYVPRSYQPARPTPLVISLHGAGGWPRQQMETTRWNALAERERFIVVYPAGAIGGGPRIWRAMRGPGLARDVRYLSDLIDKLAAGYNIDRQRIYVNGLSNGAGMSFVLSCTLSDRIAAVGMVAAAQTLPWNWCTDDRPVPMIAFHGTDDSVTPYKGGTTWVSSRAFPGVETWAANWARRNRCRPGAIESPVGADVTRRAYADCAGGADVVLFTVRGGGHTWPGGQPLPEWFLGRTTTTVDASAEMWAFFREHPLKTGRP